MRANRASNISCSLQSFIRSHYSLSDVCNLMVVLIAQTKLCIVITKAQCIRAMLVYLQTDKMQAGAMLLHLQWSIKLQTDLVSVGRLWLVYACTMAQCEMLWNMRNELIARMAGTKISPNIPFRRFCSAKKTHCNFVSGKLLQSTIP